MGYLKILRIDLCYEKYKNLSLTATGEGSISFLLHTRSFSKVVRRATQRQVPDVSQVVYQHIPNVLEVRAWRGLTGINVLDYKRIAPSWDPYLYSRLIAGGPRHVIIIQLEIIDLQRDSKCTFQLFGQETNERTGHDRSYKAVYHDRYK